MFPRKARFARKPAVGPHLVQLEGREVPTTFTVFEAAGANAAAIQTTVDDFRTSLGTLNANTAGSVGSGRREINWDGVPDTKSAPNALPFDFFNTTSPRGAVFSTPGSGFQVSAKSGVPPILFGNIEATYPTAFAAFSPERLFTAIDSNTTEISFRIPGSSTPASVTGFGAIFTDVDSPFLTEIEFFSTNNVELFSRVVLPAEGNGRFSFLGAKADTGTPIAKVRITSGAAAVGSKDITQGGTSDIVVMDDFIYGEPLTPAVGGSVGGFVFEDLNGDGTKQANEPGLPNVIVFDDVTGDNILNSQEKFTKSASDGSWSFTFAVDGSRRMRSDGPPGFTRTTPTNPPSVNLFGGSSDKLDFGYVKSPPQVTLLGLNDSNGLVRFTSTSPGTTTSIAITGLDAGEN
ncbi:MAG: hypothetical protein ACRCZF_20230, partial [Gemmataceae bacterium]